MEQEPQRLVRRASVFLPTPQLASATGSGSRENCTGRKICLLMGMLTGNEKIQIWNTARVAGDMKADRISVEEGAELHGKLEAGRPSKNGLGNAGTPKRTESDESKDARSGEEKAAPGAAVAGAD